MRPLDSYTIGEPADPEDLRSIARLLPVVKPVITRLGLSAARASSYLQDGMDLCYLV